MTRLKGFQKLTFTYEALQEWFDTLQLEKCREAIIPITEGFNRVLAEKVVAKNDLPRFDKSAVDGFAVRAEDTNGASQFKPLLFRLTDVDEFPKEGPRLAKPIWTGQPIPTGANAVVMLENTQKKSEKIEIAKQVAPYENISIKGEDIKRGDIAVKAGKRLKPHNIGLIAALGNAQIKVIDKPKIAILATGNELVQTGTSLNDKQIHESNRVILSAMCNELDAEPLDLGIVKDDVEEIIEKIQIGLKIADFVITTGGTSTGQLDFVPEAVNKMGTPGIIVHGMAIRPAMPTALAMLENKPVLILSGNPVAAITGFELFARPVISKLLGLEKEEKRIEVKAKMTKKVTTALGRKNFVRVKVINKNEELLAEPISARGSGKISTMTKANGYIIVPENREGLKEGEQVAVHLFDNIETVNRNV